MLGIPLSSLQQSGSTYILASTNDSFQTSAFQNGLFVAPGNLTALGFSSEHPVYSSADQRHKITVGSHLPTQSNVAINNETQTSNRDVAEAFFENHVTSVLDYNEGTFSTKLI